MVASGFSELSKYIGEEVEMKNKDIERNSENVPRISPNEWQDSNGLCGKSMKGYCITGMESNGMCTTNNSS